MVEIDASIFLWDFVDTTLSMSYTKLCNTSIYQSICQNPKALYTISCEVFVPWHMLYKSLVYAKMDEFSTKWKYDGKRNMYIFRNRDTMYIGLSNITNIVLKYIEDNVDADNTNTIFERLTKYKRFMERVNQTIDILDLADSIDSMMVT
jgi:hypothetical protein